MNNKSAKHFLCKLFGFSIAALSFVFLWGYILKCITNSNAIVAYLCDLFGNRQIAADFIFVISAIPPLIIFAVIITLFRKLTPWH